MRQFILFLVSAALITGFFLLKHNQSWLTERPLTYYREFPDQLKRMKEEDRKLSRFGSHYRISRQIAADLKNQLKNTGQALVLVPATAYFKQYGVAYRVPEPVVFYYFTGIKTVWPDSKNAKQANWYVSVTNGQIHVTGINNQQQLLDTIAAFNKFETTL